MCYGTGPEGSIITASIELEGQEFIALNGGPHFKFTEAISFVVYCDTQEEVDRYENQLLEGGQESQCGWLKDKFGLSWQIVPRQLTRLIQDKDARKVQNVMQAMIKMRKIVVADLERAYAQ